MISLVRRWSTNVLPTREIRAFDSGFELFILVFASIGLLISVVCIVLGIGPWSDHGVEWLLFLSGALFLNITHNAFTYHALLFFPETQKWMRGSTKASKFILWAKWLLMFSIIFGFFRFITVTSGGPDPLRIAPWIAAFIKFFPFHHGVKQISGISLIYNQKLKLTLSPDDLALKQVDRHEKREKALFFLLLITLGSTLATSIVFSGDSFLNRYLPLFGCICIFAIIWNSTRFPGVAKSNKTYFLTRLLFYPVAQFTFFGIFFLGATHGTEYLGIYQKMYKGSKVHGRRSLAGLLILTVIVVVLFLGNPYQGLQWFLAPRLPAYIDVLNWMAVFTLSFTFMHYYLDRCMFRMRDPAVRDNIGPLLLDKTEMNSCAD